MDRIKSSGATIVHKSLNGTAPDYMKAIFKFVTDVSQGQTRYVDNSKLYLPTGNHLKHFTDSFQCTTGAVWNKLLVHIREAERTPAFKSAYMKWFFNRTLVPRFLNDLICF